MIPIRNDVRTARCPMCASTRIERRGTIDYGQAASFSSHRVRLELDAEQWRCGECGSGFVQNVVPEEIAADLYSSGASGERWSRVAFDESHTREVVDELSALLRPGMRVLDVGGNTGELLDFARQRGCATAATEYSRQSREVLEAKGHTAFAALEAAGEGYDVVTGFDLFEHLYDVPGFLARCRSMLKPNGVLVILTGDIGSLSSRLSGARWWYSSYPEHIAFPSRRFLAHRAGFRPACFIATYASRGYRQPFLNRAVALAAVARRRYGGLPALAPDHVLAVLRKER